MHQVTYLLLVEKEWNTIVILGTKENLKKIIVYDNVCCKKLAGRKVLNKEKLDCNRENRKFIVKGKCEVK